MAPTCTCVKVLPKTYCAWPMSKKGKQACTCGVSCNQRHALQHSSFAAPPGSCDLLFTVQVQPVRATTPLALSWKNGARRHGKVRPVRVEWFTLCCAACGQRRSCGTAGTLGTRQTCANLPTWDRSSCGGVWSPRVLQRSVLEPHLPVHVRRGLFVRGGVWTLQLQTASLLPPHVQRSRPEWRRCNLRALRGLRDDAAVPASRRTSTL